MNELRKKINRFLTCAWDEIEYRLRLLCGQATPMKRFLVVLIIGGMWTVANIYFVVSSLYNMGKRDTEKEFLQLQPIETVQLPNESSNRLNQKEYENK